MNSLKGVSGRRLRQEFPDHIRKYLWGEHFWSTLVLRRLTAVAHQLAIVKDYIENQTRPD